jgi:hypothetical protein
LPLETATSSTFPSESVMDQSRNRAELVSRLQQSQRLCIQAHKVVEASALLRKEAARLQEEFAVLLEELALLREEAALLRAGTTEERRTPLSP